jgi:protein-disulfide isomerase
MNGGRSQTAALAEGSARAAALLDGIPQDGTALGSPDAPVTLVEFADPQCPYCADWARAALPEIVRRYVRTGRVRIVFNGMTFLGADSETALRAALAAGRQGRFWNVLELLFANQGAENRGWVTDGLLRAVADAVPGLDVGRLLHDRDGPAVSAALERAGTTAAQAGVSWTPAFAVGPSGGDLRIVRVTTLAASGLTPALDAALRE